MKNHRILHESHDYGFGVNFTSSDSIKENDKSMISAFWDGRVHFWILIIYGSISIFLYLTDHKSSAYALGGVMLACNSIWFLFKGRIKFANWLGNTKFVKWFLKLVEL